MLSVPVGTQVVMGRQHAQKISVESVPNALHMHLAGPHRSPHDSPTLTVLQTVRGSRALMVWTVVKVSTTCSDFMHSRMLHRTQNVADRPTEPLERKE